MNSPSSNSGGFAGPVSPPPPSEFFLVLPDGSCIPATRETCRLVMRQARSEQRKQGKIKRHEKAAELQMALEERAAARSVQQELAELHRSSIRWAARFKVRVEPKKPESRTSPVTKRIIGTTIRSTGRKIDAPRPASSWVIDALGMKGVIWQQSYLGRKSPGFHHGAARENWEYIVRDEAALLDAAGEPMIVSNMGDDWVEIGAGWQAMEDASTRANAKIQMLAIAPFDSDMSEAEMIAALTHFCTTVLDPLGLSYSAVIHKPPIHGDQRNFHPHIGFALRPMRRIEPYCWEVADEVCGELDGRDGVQMLRHLWAHSMSEAAEAVRSNRRYTGHGYGARGLNLEAGEHLGEGRSAVIARGGHVWAHERNRIKAERNAARRAIRDADQKIIALTAIRDAALKRIERRFSGNVPAKVFRSAQPVGRATAQAPILAPLPARIVAAATLSTPARLSAPTLLPRPRQTILTSASLVRIADRPAFSTATSAMPPKVIAPAHISRPPRTITPSVPPVDAVVRSAMNAPEAAIVRVANAETTRPARRLSTTNPIIPGRQFQVAGTPRPNSLILATRRARPAAPSLAAVVAPCAARTVKRTQKAAAPIAFAIGTTETARNDDFAIVLLQGLARARAARTRIRRKQMAVENYQVNTPFKLGGIPTLDTLPSLDGLSAVATSDLQDPSEPLSDEDRVRLERLKKLDPYVADYGGQDRQVETDYPALKALGVGWGWLTTPGVQQALRLLRDEQQEVVAQLRHEATGRPLAFAKTGPRFWPRDLAADHLRRSDRWATDPGFDHDLSKVRRMIGRAHVARDEAARSRAAASAQRPDDIGVSDGFGGVRHGPAPVFHDEGAAVHVPSFDPTGIKPTEQLIMLMMLAGKHPDRIVHASDGMLMALPGSPAMLPALLHGWRRDKRVVALVTETVRASRAAGAPVWPPAVSKAVLTYVARTSRATDVQGPAMGMPPPDLGLSPKR